MARTYPLTVPYTECLDSRANPLLFASLRLVDLRNGQSQYLSTIKQLVDVLPKTEDPSSRFALQGHIARPGQKRLRHSMRAAIWWLLPSDGTFRRASDSLQYFLTRQGRRVVLRGGDVTLPPLERYLNWVHDLASLHQEITAKKICRPKTLPMSFRESYGSVGEEKISLDRQPIIILLPGRLEGGHSVRQHPIIILHLGRLAGRYSLGQRPITIRLSGRLEIGLEQAGQPGQRCVPQWSIP